jgi:plastocyanin
MFHQSIKLYRRVLAPLLLVLTSTGFISHGYADDASQQISIKLGDSRISPATVEIQADTRTVVELTNTDLVAPHTFTIGDTVGNLIINRNVEAGKTVTAELPPLHAGSYTFYCNKKLPLQKTHREQGEEGTLIVTED